MESRTLALREKIAGLLREAAEAKVALDQAEGRVRGVPHESVIEEAAHEFGCEVSRLVQELHLRELVARQSPSGKCPGCGALAPLALKEREVLSGDGPIPCMELAGYCSCCRRTFFPLREALGFDAREVTPRVVRKATVLAAETRSFARAAIALREADIPLSAKTIERLVHDVGGELAERRDLDPKRNAALAQRPEEPPDLAVVECDGGRIRCRQPGQGPGVHRKEKVGEKNACLIRAQRKTFEEDPQPEPPACFLDPKHVADIAETEAFSVAAPLPPSPSAQEGESASTPPEPLAWQPQRLVRTVLSSLAKAQDFGQQMVREAKRRRFHEAAAQCFLGNRSSPPLLTRGVGCKVRG